MKMMIMLFVTIISIFGFKEAEKPNIKPSIESYYSRSLFRSTLKSDDEKVNAKFQELLSQPKIELGILIQKVSNGLMIMDMLKWSPCAKAGFVIGDVLTKFNNIVLVEPQDFLESIRLTQNGSVNSFHYIPKGQVIESEKVVNIQKINNGAIIFKIISNKNVKKAYKANLSDIAIERYLSDLRKSKKVDSSKSLDSISTQTKFDIYGNATTTVIKGDLDVKKANELEKVSQKEIDEYLKKMKISNTAAEKYFADGKIPANIQLNINNTTNVKDALTQLGAAGIKVDEAKVQKYLNQNGFKGNFANIQLNQVVPTDVLELYGSKGPVKKAPRISRVSVPTDPNAAAIIKKLESLNNSVDGKGKRAKIDDGVNAFTYTKPIVEKSKNNISDTLNTIEAGKKNGDGSLKDFIPASALAQQKQHIVEKGEGKPVFIPSIKSAEKKMGDRFVTKDFIPNDINPKNGVKDKPEKETSIVEEKNRDKPVFIPSVKKIDKESMEIERLILQMRKAADANLKSIKSDRSTEVNGAKDNSNDINELSQKKNSNANPDVKVAEKTTKTNVNQKELNRVDSLQKNDTLKSNALKNIKSNVTGYNTSTFTNDSMGSQKVNIIPEKSVSSLNANTEVKPIFIPIVKKPNKKVDDKFITNDFIPAQSTDKAKKTIDSNTTSIGTKSLDKAVTKLDEKNGDKPIFIPSTKTADKESQELTRLMNEMKRVANANLLLKKANNKADSDNLTIQGLNNVGANDKTSQEKNGKSGKNSSIDSIRVSKVTVNKMSRFTLASVDSMYRASRDIPVIPHFLVDNVKGEHIYFIANYKSVQHPILPERGNRFWKWLDIFIR
jgi:hypothetical protein